MYYTFIVISIQGTPPARLVPRGGIMAISGEKTPSQYGLLDLARRRLKTRHEPCGLRGSYPFLAVRHRRQNLADQSQDPVLFFLAQHGQD